MDKKPPPLERWSLGDLIKVSIGVGLLSGRAEKTADSVKGFRNYIHPYNARTSTWVADESLALIALRLVDKISESLRKKLPRSAD